MQPERHSDLNRQLAELSAEVLSLLEDPELDSDLRKLLKEGAAPCDPDLDTALRELFHRRPKGEQEYLRMRIDVLRRILRSRETEQIFRAFGVLELATPVLRKGKIRHALFSGPLKISPWTPQEKETLAGLCGISAADLPAALDKAPVFSPAQVQMLIRQQTHQAELLSRLLDLSAAAESTEPSLSSSLPSSLPSSLGLDLLQPGFAEHLSLLFTTLQQELLRETTSLAPRSLRRIQSALRRGLHLSEQIRDLSRETLRPHGEVSVHRILEQWRDRFSQQHPSLRVNLRMDADSDRVWANPHQLQHMLFTLMASVADGLPEGRAVMGLSTRNLERNGQTLLHLEIRDGGGLATFAGVGGAADQRLLAEQNEAAEEFADWFTLATRMDAELLLLRDEGIVTRAELLLPLKPSGRESETDAADDTHQLWIVEDDDREYEGLLHMLQLPDIQCTRFVSATDLRKKFALAGVPPDLVLLKYYLPDQRGAEVRTWLYEQDPSLPVILISGLQATHPGIATANSLPSTLYLQKPFDSQVLLDMVHMNLNDTLPG